MTEIKWEELDLAADSLAKASVHEPVGTKPLWKHKGWQLPAYIQHVANDLREKRAMDKSRAIATAVAAIKRWAAGVGKVDSGTRAAARKALTEWEGLKAKAAAMSDEEDSEGVALSLEAVDALSEEINFTDEGGVDLAVPTNIGKLQVVESALLDYLKVETDQDDKAEAKSLLQRIMNLIGKDRAEAAAGHKIGPAYFADEDQLGLAELFLAGAGQSSEGGLIYKPILREGKWKYSPLDAPGEAPIGITVVKNGKSDPAKMVVSMSEVLRNYEGGAIEHVTVPTSHRNKVYENTGYVRDLRMAKDDKGRWVLEAGLDFTEPDIEQKAQRGTIPNTSAGLLFNYVEKEGGSKHNCVLEHVALTSRPWLTGMRPFGVAASQEGELTVVGFSEEGLDLDSLMEEIAAGEGDAAEVELADKLHDNVIFADPGYQPDGKSRCPLDTEEHVRVSWKYISLDDNAGHYTDGQLTKIKTRIRSAMSQAGIEVGMSDELLTTRNEEALRALLGGKEDIVPDEIKDTKTLLAETFGLSEEEIKERLARADALELSDRQRGVKDKIAAWEGEKKAPAVLVEAEAILLADNGSIVVSLSQDGKKADLTVAEVVERLVAASPAVELEVKKVTEGDATKNGGAPPENADEEVELSQEVAAEARRLFLYEGATEEEAIAAAKAKLETNDQ